MNRRMLPFAAASLIFAVSIAAAATGPVYPVYEIPTEDLPDLHDGSLADWEAVVPGASLTHDDFVSVPADCGDCGAPEGCHGSAVLPESWGRIKAALR